MGDVEGWFDPALQPATHVPSVVCAPKPQERAGGVLSLIIAMLAKFTNQRARLVQMVISLVLLAGHATKQVGYLLSAIKDRMQ